MLTTDDLHLDPIYSTASYRTLLLYELNGVGLVIPVRDAQLIRFVERMHDLLQCRDNVLGNNQRRITLFSYSRNIQRWYGLSDDEMPSNLQEIQIFCDSKEDSDFMDMWMRRLGSQKKEAFPYNQLNWRLLLAGIEYIEQIRAEFEGDSLNIINNHLRRLHQALALHFCEQANAL